MSSKNRNATETIRHRYDRLAFVFDLMEWPMEQLRFSGWRKRLAARITGPRALELGVGTGKNMPYYPPGIAITAIDFSPSMLTRARSQARRLDQPVTLAEMDAQALDFPAHRFDTVFATFVFCSVPDPIEGLREARRVCKPGGRLLLLEHMRPGNPMLGAVFDALNPIAVRLSGANINRRTIENVQRAGWQISKIENLSSDIVRWIEATP